MKLDGLYNLKGMKILIIDDTPANLDVLRRTLEMEGWVISIALSGEKSLEIAQKFLPDLILLDIMMPGIDGFETCKRLMEQKELSETPIIFLSAKTETEDIVKGFQLGGVDYITKPFRQEEVLARIRSQLFIKALLAEREESLQILNQFADDLQSHNEDLESFTKFASHDLKAPLRRVEQLSQLFKTNYGHLLDENGIKDLERIDKSMHRMIKLVEDLLQYACMGKDLVDFEPTNLQEVVETVLEDLDYQIKDARGKVHVESLPTVQAFPVHMRQLFQNLLGNALKFQRDGVPLEINIKSSLINDNQWKITVEDNGIGFDENHAESIVKPFAQLNPKGVYEGSGLGLSFCQRIVDIHKGIMEIHSQPENGTQIAITLPVEQ